MKKYLHCNTSSAPARSVTDAISLYTLLKQDIQSQSTLGTFLPMYDALTDKPYFEPVFLNDLVPTETRDHYNFMQMFKTRGCPAEKNSPLHL